MDRAPSTPPKSGLRRKVRRIAVRLSVLVACEDGRRVPGRVENVSSGGMFVECAQKLSYGDVVKLVVSREGLRDWLFLPATVRWTTDRGCGLEFGLLDSAQRRSLERLVATAAA